MRRRINIGLIIDDIDNYFANQAAKGADQAAKALDANLFIFPGHYIGRTDAKYADKKYEYQYNTIFRLPTERNVDIIYILQGTICSRADMEVQKRFLEAMPNVPIVCLFSSVEGYHSVTFDNVSGLKKVITHLIEEHDAKEIGFVSGPAANRDANERLEVYKSVLREHNIPVEERKIVCGDFSMDSKIEVNKLLDYNGHLDAIAFANDSMALGAYAALRKRGLEPGKDILVTGFDDDVFAISMEPPLTTVEASSAQLTYKAVLNAENYINGSALKDMTVETSMVQRGSCGCNELDVEDMCARFRLNDLESRDFYEEIKKYLFDFFFEGGRIEDTKSAVEAFLDAYIGFLKADVKESAIAAMNDQFSKLLVTDLYMVTTPEKLFNLMETLQYKALTVSDNEHDHDLIYDVFAHYFRRLTFTGILPANAIERRNEKIKGVVNRQMGEVFLIDSETDIPYERLLGGLYEMGFTRSLVYRFQGKVKNPGTEQWKVPTSILLKAISDEEGLRTPPEEQQLIRTERIFENDFITSAGHRTMIVQPLFVGADLYGLLVNELQPTHFFSVSSIAFQMSVTLRSLLMIEEHNKAKKSLQISLERFIKENTELEEIAQKDELTGLYNRRGFITNAEKVLADPSNIDKMAVICYADMDNLKKVNDKFGHDDGDFALRTVAGILEESFRESDIIGRIGGDEFIALAVTGSDCDVVSLKQRIDRVTKRFNKNSGKPYAVEISTGIFKFRCNGKIEIYDVINSADQLLYEEKIRKKADR
ncbi:MAG: GGDEF domain-containing protein [Clostridiales bacterium]|nr:GGDEF domain-containing protein [Clostridiales bacterium]